MRKQKLSQARVYDSEEGGGGVGIRAEDLVEALAELGAEAARPRGPHGGTAARGASQVLQQMLRPPAAIRTHRSDLMLIKSIHKNLLVGIVGLSTFSQSGIYLFICLMSLKI